MSCRWTDQPELLEQCEELCALSVHGSKELASVQVHYVDHGDHGGERYYVTIGNLFGSTTIFIPSAHEMLRFLDKVQKAADGYGRIDLGNYKVMPKTGGV